MFLCVINSYGAQNVPWQFYRVVRQVLCHLQLPLYQPLFLVLSEVQQVSCRVVLLLTVIMPIFDNTAVFTF